MNHLLTVDEVSVHINCPKSAIYKMTCAKKIPYVKIYGHLRFDKEKIDKWIEGKSFDPLAC
jgi:excisionase family DNA binding protein